MNQSALDGFVKIVEMDSFSAAAEALYLSQSALSQQIRTLEGQLQFELFQHVPRRVILTPAGRDFYPKAKQLTALYQEAVRHARAVQQQANPPERHLQIAGCHEAMRMFVYDVFSLTSDLCLQYTPILGKCANRSEIWRSLKKGEMDLSFQLESAEFYAQGLTFMPLFYVPELCIPIHPPADMPVGRLTLEQALQYRWLPSTRLSTRQVCCRRGWNAGWNLRRWAASAVRLMGTRRSRWSRRSITADRISALCGCWTGAGDTALASCWGKNAKIRW